MPFSKYPAPETFTPASRAEDLLTSRAHFGEFWETEFGGFRVFYVRGTSGYKRSVIRAASGVYQYTQEMQDHVRRMKDWGSPYFDWHEPISKNQPGDAWNKVPIAFDKAAKVILLCGVAAEEERKRKPVLPTGAAVYGQMTIQPAVYFIHGFDVSALDQVRDRDDGFIHRLREETSQKDPAVFSDMTKGLTVTLPLAQKVQATLRTHFPALPIGDIDIPQGRRFVASRHETIDLK